MCPASGPKIRQEICKHITQSKKDYDTKNFTNISLSFPIVYFYEGDNYPSYVFYKIFYNYIKNIYKIIYKNNFIIDFIKFYKKYYKNHKNCYNPHIPPYTPKNPQKRPKNAIFDPSGKPCIISTPKIDKFLKL